MGIGLAGELEARETKRLVTRGMAADCGVRDAERLSPRTPGSLHESLRAAAILTPTALIFSMSPGCSPWRRSTPSSTQRGTRWTWK
jgi:hypothetical protein